MWIRQKEAEGIQAQVNLSKKGEAEEHDLRLRRKETKKPVGGAEDRLE